MKKAVIMENDSKRYRIFDTYVDALSMDETIERVEEIIKKGIPTQHVVINALKVNLIEKDEKLRRIVNSCPLINADGASILWAAKLFKIPIPERVTGVDLFGNLLKIASQKGYRIYLFGAKEEAVKKACEVIKKQYPDIVIAGYRNGFFEKEDEKKIVSDIAASGADMLFVGFPSPKKEFWINKYLSRLNVPFVMGVGGSIDITAGVTKRAPVWMQRLGFEWFFRFIQEPRRMWKRYIIGNAKFILLTFRYKFFTKKKTEIKGSSS